MKKILSVILIFLIALGLLAGCGVASVKEETAALKLRVVTTIFPIYDWVVNVLGEGAGAAEVTMLLDKGVDLHSYQPTADDIVRISNCDLFIYVGGESDEWVEDALQEAINKNMVVIDLMDVLGDSVKEEEVVEGMEREEEEEEEGDEEEEIEYDEHVWLSLRNAAVLCRAIAEALGQINRDKAELYTANVEAYLEKLAALDEKYRETVEAGAQRTILFGDRFPFRYLADDYGLDYYAAFVGCSAESEASFETIIFLANKLDELGLPAVLQIESADGSIARTVVENTRSKDQQILTMDSMQSTTAKDVAAGASYLSIMEKNLDVLKAALG